MNQDQHEAHDPEATLSASNADTIANLLDDYNFQDEGESQAEIYAIICEIADAGEGDREDGDEPRKLTTEQAKVAADFLREHLGDESADNGALRDLDAVARQHGTTDGTDSPGEKGTAEHDEHLR